MCPHPGGNKEKATMNCLAIILGVTFLLNLYAVAQAQHDNSLAVVTYDDSNAHLLDDPENRCNGIFTCIINSTKGWQSNGSLQFARTDNQSEWSNITGDELVVKPAESYEIVTHMELNDRAVGSHVVLEAFNRTSTGWYQLQQCPAETSGPLEWEEFRCKVIIPDNTTQLRPVLNAGWSSSNGEEAVTLFDEISIIPMNETLIGTKTNTSEPKPSETFPMLNDPNLTWEIVSDDIEFPTSMAFLAPDDILVLEKNAGTVRRILNGNSQPEPLLHVNVSTLADRGMLGIATSKTETGKTYVFLYYTEAQTSDAESASAVSTEINGSRQDAVQPGFNRLYRYELIGNKLADPKLLISIPTSEGNTLDTGIHNGGQVLIGPDNNVYLVVGDVGGYETQTENFGDLLHAGSKSFQFGTSVVFRISQDGQAVKGILGETDPQNKYYAYGIRNSFGMDFDPASGHLWDTENGLSYGDEINLVRPGFNSGWKHVEGISNMYDFDSGELYDFNGKGEYSDPEFTWGYHVAPTAMKFLNSDKLGNQYENDLFVGNFNEGSIYRFDLNTNRTELLLQGLLADKKANSPNEGKDTLFGRSFGGITDIEVGPDGYLYVLALGSIVDYTHYDDPYRGIIYKIKPLH
jgi:glucose/arabinose dehydrogenase